MPPSGWSNSYFIDCITGDNYPGIIRAFRVHFDKGDAYYNNFFPREEIDITLSGPIKKFYFKSYPKISILNYNRRSPEGGQDLVILGKDFSPAVKDNNVFVHEDECTVSKATDTEISCTTKKATYAPTTPLSTKFIAHKGLWRRVYNIPSAKIDSLTNLTGFPDTGAQLDDTILESLTAIRTTSNKTGQYINGYFKALHSGKHRFYVSASGPVKLDLQLNESDPSSKETLINSTLGVWARDIFKHLENTETWSKIRSDWTSAPLVQGTLYYIEIYHASNQGLNYLALGVEIAQTDITTVSNAACVANRISQVTKLSMKPKVEIRELDQVKVPTLDGDYKVKCKKYTTDTSVNPAIIKTSIVQRLQPRNNF